MGKRMASLDEELDSERPVEKNEERSAQETILYEASKKQRGMLSRSAKSTSEFASRVREKSLAEMNFNMKERLKCIEEEYQSKLKTSREELLRRKTNARPCSSDQVIRVSLQKSQSRC